MRRLGASLVALALLALWPAPDAWAAAKATYVGIVIGGHGSGCVKWHAGITGDEILNDVASVHYRRDGLIDQIDGQPSPPHADSTHYWSYWRDTGSQWAYSHTGAGGTNPAAGTVEGWSYVNGASSAPAPDRAPAGLYASLCGSRDPRPVAAPTHHRSGAATAQRVSTTRGPPRRPGGRTAAGPTAGSSGGATSAPRGAKSTAPIGKRSASGSATAAARGAAPGTGASSGSGGPLIVDARPASTTSKAAHSSALPVILGLALALLLAGGAGWTVLRRRRAEAADN